MMKIRIIALCLTMGLLAACDNDGKPANQGTPMGAVEELDGGAEPAQDDTAITEKTAGERVVQAVAPAQLDPTGAEERKTAVPTQVSAVAPLDLARTSGCLACHSVEKKVVGPAWKDVSARYRGKADIRATLVEKVKKGGAGNWSDVTGGIAMPPYSPRVKDQDIERLVDFVLSLGR